MDLSFSRRKGAARPTANNAGMSLDALLSHAAARQSLSQTAQVSVLAAAGVAPCSPEEALIDIFAARRGGQGHGHFVGAFSVGAFNISLPEVKDRQSS